MKKLFLIALAASLSFSASAQTKEVAAIQKKLDRSDAAIADAKKSKNINTWLDRANILADAALVYTSKLLSDIPAAQLTLSSMAGNPESIEEVVVNQTPYSKYIYPTFDVYVTADGMVSFWESKEEMIPDALNKSLEALEQAKEVNAATFSKSGKATQVVERLSAEFNSLGRNKYIVANHVEGGDAFMAAYDVKQLKGETDTVAYYFSGICYFEGKEFEKSLTVMEKLVEEGYLQDGTTYYYLANSQAALGQNDAALKTYEDAFLKYPQNSNIMGGLINAYINADKDPEEIIKLIHKAQELDPKNTSLYQVEAQIWDQAGKMDKAYEALEKAIEIDPTVVNAHYNYAVFKVLESDALVEAANKLDINDVKGYNDMVTKAEELRKESVAKLEECYEMEPTNETVLSLLSQMYFICRDYSDEYTQKYNDFKAAHPELQ